MGAEQTRGALKQMNFLEVEENKGQIFSIGGTP